MIRKEISEYAVSLNGAVLDKPFSEDFDTVVLRHSDTKKWFGILLKAPKRKVGLDGEGETDVLNLKCDPTLAHGLFQTYKGIVPGYHMNKHHWISVILNSDVPFVEMQRLIGLSYELTAKKRPM